MASATIYSTAGGDGDIGYAAGFDANSWATQHAAATGVVDSSSASRQAPYAGDNGSGRLLRRAYFPFDLSSLSGITVSAATLSVFHLAEDDANDQNTGIVTSAQASGTTLATGDYDALGTTYISDTISTNSYTGSAYNAFTLDATGRTQLETDAGGYTMFGLVTEADRSNTAPGSSEFYRINIYFADQTGTANDPKLDITYTVASATFTPRAIMF